MAGRATDCVVEGAQTFLRGKLLGRQFAAANKRLEGRRVQSRYGISHVTGGITIATQIISSGIGPTNGERSSGCSTPGKQVAKKVDRIRHIDLTIIVDVVGIHTVGESTDEHVVEHVHTVGNVDTSIFIDIPAQEVSGCQ